MTFCWPISPSCTVQGVKSLELGCWSCVKCWWWWMMNNERLRCIEALGASTWVVSLKVTLISGSISHCMFSVSARSLSSSVSAWGLEMSHFCHFWAFWPLLRWNILKGGCCHESLASNLSLSGCCLPPLTSVAWGMLYFVPWWTLLYVPWWTLFYCGSLPWRSLLCLWGMIWTSGGHRSSWSTGCWAVCSWDRISLVHLLLSVSPPLCFFWNETWDIF